MARNESVTIRIRVDDKAFRAELARLRVEIERLRTRASRPTARRGATTGPTVAGKGVGLNRAEAVVGAGVGVDIGQSAQIALVGANILDLSQSLEEARVEFTDNQLEVTEVGKEVITSNRDLEKAVNRAVAAQTPVLAQAGLIPAAQPPSSVRITSTTLSNADRAAVKAASLRGWPSTVGFTNFWGDKNAKAGTVQPTVASKGTSQMSAPAPLATVIPEKRGGGAAAAPRKAAKIAKAVAFVPSIARTRATGSLEGLGTRVLGTSIGLMLGIQVSAGINEQRNTYIKEALEAGEIPDPEVLNSRLLEAFGEQILDIGQWGLSALHTWLVGMPVAITTIAIRGEAAVGGYTPNDVGAIDLGLSEYYYNSQDWFGVNDEAYQKVWDAKREWYKARGRAAKEASREVQQLSEQVATRLQELGLTGLNRGQLESISMKRLDGEMNRKIIDDFDAANPFPTERSVNPFGQNHSRARNNFVINWLGGMKE